MKSKMMEKGRKKTFALSNLLKYAWVVIRFVVIFGLCFIILYPFLIKILNSIKSSSDFIDPTVRFLAKKPTMNNIATVFNAMDYASTLFNTLGISLLTSFIQVSVCAFVGYGFARFKFWGSKILFFGVILTLLIPPQSIMIPFFLKFRFFLGSNLSLIDTIWPFVILSFTGLGLRNGLYIFMLRQIFTDMPKELEEAAYIDGCNYFKTFFKIMLPSAIPTLVTVFLFAFSWQWTDTFYNNLFFVDFNVFTLKVSQLSLLSEDVVMQSIFKNTGVILAIIPLALLYMFAQKAFVQSVERSGLVG